MCKARALVGVLLLGLAGPACSALLPFEREGVAPDGARTDQAAADGPAATGDLRRVDRGRGKDGRPTDGPKGKDVQLISDDGALACAFPATPCGGKCCDTTSLNTCSTSTGSPRCTPKVCAAGKTLMHLPFNGSTDDAADGDKPIVGPGSPTYVTSEGAPKPSIMRFKGDKGLVYGGANFPGDTDGTVLLWVRAGPWDTALSTPHTLFDAKFAAGGQVALTYKQISGGQYVLKAEASGSASMNTSCVASQTLTAPLSGYVWHMLGFTFDATQHVFSVFRDTTHTAPSVPACDGTAAGATVQSVVVDDDGLKAGPATWFLDSVMVFDVRLSQKEIDNLYLHPCP